MTEITITGALTMLSNNGDGPQLLTEAAEFLNALAQMGVKMAVEINLRPVGAEKPEPPPTYTTPAHVVEHVADTADDITLHEGHPSLAPAPVDFTPAAPAQPDAPQWDLTPHAAHLRGEAPEWRKLSREQRTALLNVEGRTLAKQLGRAPTMVEWDANRPNEYPSASGVSKYLGMGWIQIADNWTRQS